MTRQTLGLPTICKERCRLLISLLDRACSLNGLSRRQLARQLGLTVSSVNSYYSGRVDPLRCKLFIQHRLAQLNGSSVDELVRFYETADWRAISFREPSLRLPASAGLRSGHRFRRLPLTKPSPQLKKRIRGMLQGVKGEFLPSKDEIDDIAQVCVGGLCGQ